MTVEKHYESYYAVQRTYKHEFRGIRSSCNTPLASLNNGDHPREQ